MAADPFLGGNMINERRLTVRLSPLMKTRVRVRAEMDGITSAEYLRRLIENDLKKGRVADALAELNTEFTLVTGMMVRELATHAFGKEGGKSLEEWASGRAEELLQKAIQDGVWGI